MRIDSLLPGRLFHRAREGGKRSAEAERLASVMMPAPVAGAPRADVNAPDLTTSWERVVGDVPARSPLGILVEPKAGGGRYGERPYADIAADQVAAYRRAVAPEFFAARPEFHAKPFTAPDTAPMQKLPANAMVPPPPGPGPARAVRTPRTVRTESEDEALTLLRRVRDGLKDQWRPEAFTADMRHTSGLPAFRRTARAVGWCGLDRPQAEMPPAGQIAGRWTGAFRQITAATEAARAELDAVHARHAAMALAAERAA